MPLTPEQQARQEIDTALAGAGWVVQDRDEMNIAAGLGVAVREFRMAPGHGFADYMLFVDGRAAGVLEAKPVGYTLSSVELQADKYASVTPTWIATRSGICASRRCAAWSSSRTSRGSAA